MGYDDDKFDRIFMSDEAARRGDRLHRLAALLIAEKVKLEDTSQTLNMYVNESIGFRLSPEQRLYYSDNAFGTADACGLFNNKVFRCSDLKTGTHMTSFEQLQGYCALFCLEYGYSPFDLEFELRIYQNDEVRFMQADPVGIDLIKNRFVYLDKRIQYLKEGLGE